MTSRRIPKSLILICAALLSASDAFAQKPTPIHNGEVLSGALTAMRSKKTKGITFQLTTEPRRLPPPNGLCNLETGPETFQLITSSDAQAAQLKNFIGKEISVKVDEIACAEAAGQMSEAVVTKWSIVSTH
jgi:hypothetical protein